MTDFKVTVTPDTDGRGANRCDLTNGSVGTMVEGVGAIPAWGSNTTHWAIYHLIERVAVLEADNQALVDAGKRLRELADGLMPGLKYIALQDYTLLTAFDEWDRVMWQIKQKGESA